MNALSRPFSASMRFKKEETSASQLVSPAINLRRDSANVISESRCSISRAGISRRGTIRRRAGMRMRFRVGLGRPLIRVGSWRRASVLRGARVLDPLPRIVQIELVLDLRRRVFELADSLAEAPRDLGNPLCTENEQNDEENQQDLPRSNATHNDSPMSLF